MSEFLFDDLSNLLPEEDWQDTYSLGPKLGKGRSGVVRLAENVHTGELLACKSISKEKLLKKDTSVEALRAEVRIMKAVAGHPNVVELKGAFEDADAVHLVMDLCQGGDLFEYMDEKTVLSEAEAARIFKQIAAALCKCGTEGVCHRDIKPENVLLCGRAVQPDGSRTPLVKLADFGLAIELGPGERAQGRGLVGSLVYMAPEIVEQRPYGFEVDMWSLGVSLYFALSGTLPFWGKNKDQIFSSILRSKPDFSRPPWPTVSEGAKHLIRLMLTADPSRRATPDDVMKHPWVETNCASGWNRSKSMPSRGPLQPPTSTFQRVLPRPPPLILIPTPPISLSTWDLPAPLGWNAGRVGLGSQRSERGGRQRLDRGQRGGAVGEAGRVGADGGDPDAIPAEYAAMLAALTLSHVRNGGQVSTAAISSGLGRQAHSSPILGPSRKPNGAPDSLLSVHYPLPPRTPKTPKGRYQSPEHTAGLEYPMPPPPTNQLPPPLCPSRQSAGEGAGLKTARVLHYSADLASVRVGAGGSWGGKKQSDLPIAAVQMEPAQLATAERRLWGKSRSGRSFFGSSGTTTMVEEPLTASVSSTSGSSTSKSFFGGSRSPGLSPSPRGSLLSRQAAAAYRVLTGQKKSGHPSPPKGKRPSTMVRAKTVHGRRGAEGGRSTRFLGGLGAGEGDGLSYR